MTDSAAMGGFTDLVSSQISKEWPAMAIDYVHPRRHPSHRPPGAPSFPAPAPTRATQPDVPPNQQILRSVVDRQRALDEAMDGYVMWRQRYLDSGCRLPRAEQEFSAVLRTLEGIQSDLARWRSSGDPHVHAALRILGDNLAEALPPVRLMIEKARTLARR